MPWHFRFLWHVGAHTRHGIIRQLKIFHFLTNINAQSDTVVLHVDVIYEPSYCSVRHWRIRKFRERTEHYSTPDTDTDTEIEKDLYFNNHLLIIIYEEMMKSKNKQMRTQHPTVRYSTRRGIEGKNTNKKTTAIDWDAACSCKRMSHVCVTVCASVAQSSPRHFCFLPFFLSPSVSFFLEYTPAMCYTAHITSGCQYSSSILYSLLLSIINQANE